jgi:hypothetical protein
LSGAAEYYSIGGTLQPSGCPFASLEWISQTIRAQRRAIAAGIAGNVMEWYDFSVYGENASGEGHY